MRETGSDAAAAGREYAQAVEARFEASRDALRRAGTAARVSSERRGERGGGWEAGGAGGAGA